MYLRIPTLIVLTGSLATGCGPESTHSKQEVSGSVQPAPAASREVAVVWYSINDDRPRPRPYLYRVGMTSAASFSGMVPEPPEEPRWQGISVGLLVQLPPSFNLPDGPLNEDDQQRLKRELTLDVPHSDPLIFRAGVSSSTNVDGPSWLDEFPEGISCAVCQPAGEGAVFDTLVPGDCSRVVLKEGKVCNFT